MISWKQMITYGGVNTVVFPANILSAWVLVDLGVDYRIATTVGYALHVILAYALNRVSTYREISCDTRATLLRTALVHTTMFILTLMVTSVLIETGYFDFIVARVVTAMLVGGIGYFLDTVYTFRSIEE